jgi:DNA primase
MGFTPDFLDEIRNRVPVSEVVGARVRLIKKGREHSGLCPFHGEKTPSFTVNDDKGFYHCFGCGAHGDVIKFITETESLSFPEVVERLARTAGLEIPDYSPGDRAKAEMKKTLYDVMEAACNYYETLLLSQGGREGAEYLKRRGLKKEVVQHFRLGFASNNRTALKEAMLARDGITEQMLVEAGLLIQLEEENGRRPDTYDRFRHRVMFPITDRQGRVVAFGGRALRSDVKAKYLNSPETPLFHKGRLLYNMANARRPSYEKGRVIVTEGYMDVIAISQAGFENAVAPLGTAVTEDQIRELWRMSPEPVMCFDGDKAGRRASVRVVERALPLLKAGYSIRFTHLPDGEDPDSYVASHGAGALEKILDKAMPLSELLWRHVIVGMKTDTPEARAGLEQKLVQTLSEIKDKTIRGYYEKDFEKKFDRLLGDHSVRNINLHDDNLDRRSQASTSQYTTQNRGQNQGRGKTNHFRENVNSSYSGGKSGKNEKWGAKKDLPIKKSDFGQMTGNAALMRERLIILTVLNHPWMALKFDEDFATFKFESLELDKLRNEIINIAVRDTDLDRERLHSHLHEIGHGRALEIILKQGVLKADWFAWPGADPIDVEQGWEHVIGRYRRVFNLEKELEAVKQELAQNMAEEVFARMIALQQEIETAKGNEASIEGYGVASGRKEDI